MAMEIKRLFLEDNISLKDHYDAQNTNKTVYKSTLCSILDKKADITKSSRSRILAAACAHKDYAWFFELLEISQVFTLPCILKALELLDAGRKKREIEKKINRLEKQGTAKKRKINHIKAQIHELEREEHIGSLSGSLSKKIRMWVNNFSEDNLEYFALNMPKHLWKNLANLVHFNPKDFKLSWFLDYIYGKEAPEDSVCFVASSMTQENIIPILTKYKIPYSYIKGKFGKNISDDAKNLIASYSDIDTLVWWYEELSTPKVDEMLLFRLKDGERPKFGYGKLCERLLYFREQKNPAFELLVPCADERLRQISLGIDQPVAVIGDASPSMGIAIKTSTIIASALAAICEADLKFFDSILVEPDIIPRNVGDMLLVTDTIKTNRATAPAAGLWPYYEKKKIIKTFIIVTDEEENTPYNDYYFHELFAKYRTEVYPARIIFISFLSKYAGQKGQMVVKLEKIGIETTFFKFDQQRPDLTKMDHIFGFLSI